MANKNCMVFETIGNVQSLNIEKIDEGKSDGLIRMSGIFGVCGVKNGNNRIYNKENYGLMVEALQKQIQECGCPGELEHPNTMNIDLNNVSHKIESIQMNEDGTITGTIVLLNTTKGKNAQAMVEGGLPLYISSRGAGSIDESGNVTLSTIKTYDLVGTPGFAQAKLNLAKGQRFESLCESLEDGYSMYAIINEGDDLLGDGDDKKDEPKEEPKKDEPKEEPKEEPKKEEEPKEEPTNNDDDNNKNSDNTTMTELKQAIDKLTEKVTNLEAELHIAQESLTSKETEIATLNEKLSAIKPVNYDAIEKWVMEEYAPEFKQEITESVMNTTKEFVCEEFAPIVQKWVCEEFAPEVQNWVCEEFAPEVQNWVCEEFAPEVQNWVCEEFAPEVQNWVCEEFAPEVQNWVLEEYTPQIEGWVMEEYTPETSQQISESVEAKVSANVTAFMEAQKQDKLSTIDALLESMENNSNAALDLLAEQKQATKFAGVYCVENMPKEYQPSWNSLTESRQEEIVRQSRAYDFTKQGVLESFWSSVEFNQKPVQAVNENKDVVNNYHSNVIAQMMRLRKA
jgi:hypothetical protein